MLNVYGFKYSQIHNHKYTKLCIYKVIYIAVNIYIVECSFTYVYIVKNIVGYIVTYIVKHRVKYKVKYIVRYIDK